MSANPNDAPFGSYAERFHRGISEWNRLVLDDKQPAPHLQWLEDSANEHESFFRALFEAATSARGRAAKSKPFESYDLFYDLILRNAEQGRAALRWFDEGLGWQELSYGELVRDSEDLGTRWRRLGLAPGMALCIILPMGPDWLRSLAAALRLGLVISTLPVYGDAFLQHRLSLLAPDAIVIEPSTNASSATIKPSSWSLAMKTSMSSASARTPTAPTMKPSASSPASTPRAPAPSAPMRSSTPPSATP